MGQPFENDGRATHLLRVTALDTVTPGPFFPPVDRFFQPAFEFFGIGRRNQVLIQILRSPPQYRKVRTPIRGDLPHPLQVVAMPHFQRLAAGDEQTVGAAEGNKVTLPLPDPRFDFPIVEDRGDVHAEFHLTPHALQHSQDLAVRVMFTARAHGHAVQHVHLAGLRRVDGFQDQGVGDVTAGYTVVADGVNPAIAAVLPINQSSEATRGIDPRQAAPIDRTAFGHQCSCVAIRDKTVITDRWIGFLHRGPPVLVCIIL